MALTIWGRLNSHNVKKVVWLAEELGLPYVRHDVGGQFGMDADYLAKNPNALIPTIEEDDFVLWESNTILRYLAAKYGAAPLWPSDLQQRALAERWMDWHFTYAEAQRGAFINLVRRAETDRNPGEIAKSAEDTARLMSILDQALAEQQWLSGGEFGIGDIPMGVYVHTWFTLKIERPDLLHVRKWYDRLCQRPGYATSVMIPLT